MNDVKYPMPTYFAIIQDSTPKHLAKQNFRVVMTVA